MQNVDALRRNLQGSQEVLLLSPPLLTAKNAYIDLRGAPTLVRAPSDDSRIQYDRY
jgi:hypothetical protein